MIYKKGPMPVVTREARRILLVGSDACHDVEKQFARADCHVVKTDAGAAAVAYAKHNSFSAAVLMSTGREMDLAETALNLRDIQPSLEIIILVDRAPNKEMAAQADAILRAIPNSRILVKPELSSFLVSSKWAKSTGVF